MTRAFVIAASLALVLTRRAPAQQLDDSTTGVRVRVRLCASATTGTSARVRDGTIIGHDSTVLLLRVRDELAQLPLARVQSLEANMRPERDFRALGMIAGLFAGPVVAVRLAGDSGDGMAALAMIPVGLLVGPIVGYWLGNVASDDGAWRPLSLGSAQGASC